MIFLHIPIIARNFSESSGIFINKEKSTPADAPLSHYIQLVTPSVVPSAVSTVTMTLIIVFHNSLFFMLTHLLSASLRH